MVKMVNMKILLMFFLGITLVACTPKPSDNFTMRSNDVVLSDAALVLHREGLETEAKIIKDAAVRIEESRRKREGSVFIGFVPDQRLREYALMLKEMGRAESAQKLEKCADEYLQNNLRGFQRQLNLYQQTR
jgi:hypothetical protein